ncbi:MAG: hypothetical protein IAE79_02075 [Anaerolinea sp.]|nr:hypothetical protein [Anaerolinea sp.]
MGAEVAAWHSSANAYLVVWQSNGNVWARPFLSTGTPLNPAFAVSTANGITPAAQPAVARIPGSSAFMVAWNQWGWAMNSPILARTATVTGPEGDVLPIAGQPTAVLPHHADNSAIICR